MPFHTYFHNSIFFSWAFLNVYVTILANPAQLEHRCRCCFVRAHRRHHNRALL